MNIAPLSPSDEMAALELMSACFDDEPVEYFRSYHRLLPAGRPDVQLAAKVEGRLVGYLACRWVEHYFGDRILPVANIGALCTHPDYRRRGIARGLLAAALEQVDSDRHPLTGVHAAAPELFGEQGFWPVPHTEFVAKVPERAPAPDRGTLFGPVDDDDLEELFDLYRRENRQLLGPLVRSRRYFNGQQDWMSTLPHDIAWETMRQIGRSTGYLRYRREPGRLNLLEVVASGRDRGRAAAAHMLQLAHAEGLEQVRGRISPKAPFLRGIEQLTEVEVGSREGLMFKINDLDGLLAAVGPHLTLRRRHLAVTSPPVNLDIGGQVRSLSFPSAQAEFGPAIDDAPAVEISEGEFLALVFGCPGSASVLQRGQVRVDSRAQLEAVFPEDGWVLWEADHY